MAVSDAFSGGVVGCWFDADTISDFQDAAEGGSDLSAYSTRATYGANGLFGLWKDLSGNGNNALQTNIFERGCPINESAWQFAGNVYEDLTVANVGGSTSSFYFAAAMALGSYYGTIYSDQTTSTASNGFRIFHNADGDGTNPLIIFTANGGGGSSTTEGNPNINSGTQVRLDTGGTVFANGSFSNIFVLECWYNGSRLYARINAGTTSQSSSTLSVSAGSSTAYINSNRGTDYGGSGLDIYGLIITRNSLPSAALRDEIAVYLLDKTQNGGAAGLTGNSLAVSTGNLSAPSGKTASLTGRALTLSRGTLTPALAMPLTGQSGTLSQGTLVPVSVRSLTGSVLMPNHGTMVATLSLPLTGLALTTATGTLNTGNDKSSALAGQALTLSQGALTTSTGVGLTGQSLAVAKGDFGQTGTPTLTGQSLTLSQGTLTANVAGWRRLSGDTTSAGWTAANPSVTDPYAGRPDDTPDADWTRISTE